MDDVTRSARPDPMVVAEVVATSRELVRHASAAIARSRHVREHAEVLVSQGRTLRQAGGAARYPVVLAEKGVWPR